MSKAITFSIKESIPEIKKLIKSNDEFLAQRLKVLLECKRNERQGISLRSLVKTTGYCQDSVHTWRKLYIAGGLDSLLSHNRTNNKPKSFTNEEHELLNKKLNDSENGLLGYKELQQWIETEFNKKLKYITVYKYAKRNFNTKIKVARKSHVKKDIEAGESFKKTSITSVKNI